MDDPDLKLLAGIVVAILVGAALAERVNPDKAVNIDHHLGNADWALGTCSRAIRQPV